MREVAVVSFAQTPYVRRERRRNEVEMLMPVIAQAIERSGIPKAQIGFTCSGSSDYLQGQSFAFVGALDAASVVALGRIVLTRRELVVMLEAFDKGLLATTLRYAYEVRDQADYFEDIPDIKLPDEMRELASHIIDTKAGSFDPKKFEDHYETALVELLRRKQAGLVVEPIGDAEPEQRNVINLMDALRAGGESVGGPTAFSQSDRHAFAHELDRLLAAIPVLRRNLDHSDAQHTRIVDAILAGEARGRWIVRVGA